MVVRDSWSPPVGARKKAARSVASGHVAETKLAAIIRSCYERERSQYETLVGGQPAHYLAPKSYKGTIAKRLAEAPDVGIEGDKDRGSVWERLALVFASQHIDPETYMRVQFDPSSLKLRRPPEPAQLLTAERRAAYETFRASMSDVIAMSLVTQQDVATTEIGFAEAAGRSTAVACACVLTNEALELSPLFRYCLARSMTGHGFQELAHMFLVRAARQFLGYREHYEQHWAQHLPRGFGRLAERINCDE